MDSTPSGTVIRACLRVLTKRSGPPVAIIPFLASPFLASRLVLTDIVTTFISFWCCFPLGNIRILPHSFSSALTNSTCSLSNSPEHVIVIGIGISSSFIGRVEGETLKSLQSFPNSSFIILGLSFFPGLNFITAFKFATTPFIMVIIGVKYVYS